MPNYGKDEYAIVVAVENEELDEFYEELEAVLNVLKEAKEIEIEMFLSV